MQQLNFNWQSDDGKEVINCTSEDLRQLVVSNYKNKFRPGLKFYRVVCPRCYIRNFNKGEVNYNHTNLSISKEFTWGYCFRCNAIFTDKFYGATSEVSYDLGTFKQTSTYDFKIDRVNVDTYLNATPLEMHVEGIEYIHSRNKYYNVANNQFKLRYKTNKLIIPYLDLNGNPFYYQLRYVDVSKSPNKSKYFNAVINNKPIYIAPDHCGKPIWKPENTTILVEGALDAIALKIVLGNDYNIVCIMGKSITHYQVLFLKWLGIIGNIYILMDETSLSEIVRDDLIKYKINSNIIPSDGTDSEEMLVQLGPIKYKELLLSCMGNTNNYKLNFDSIYKLNTYVDENINDLVSIKLNF